MKKKIFLSVAVIAVLVASLAINLSTNNSSASNVNLSELIQTADAAEFWTFGMDCIDPFQGQSWAAPDPQWLYIPETAVPFCDNPVGGGQQACLAGGVQPCNPAFYHNEMVFSGYDPLMNPIYTPQWGVWIGGDQIALERIPGSWNPATFNIIRSVAIPPMPPFFSNVAHQVQ